MKRLTLLATLLCSIGAFAQLGANGQASSSIFVPPSFKLCLGVDNGQGACLQQTGINAATFSGALTVAGSLNVSGIFSKYNGLTTAGLGVPVILATLDQTGVSTANSGAAQNVLASTPAAGHYRLFYYADESAGCTTAGSAAFTILAGWTDATHARATATTSFTPTAAATGTGLFTQGSVDFWAATGTAVTVTATYTACTTGTWTYDLHAYVEEVK
jgi:hypothetical protein